MKIKIILPIIFLSLLSSCLVVKYDQKDAEQEKSELSPRPKVELSEEYIRSSEGDLIAFLPNEWFFIDTKGKANPNIFGIAANPDYSLSLVFYSFGKTPTTMVFAKEGNLIKLARHSLDKQLNQSGGVAKLVGDIEHMQIGSKKFATYKTSTTGGALISTTAVFISEFGNCYRASLIPMDILGKPIPSRAESDDIFISVLTGINY
jgi:hypothetical protein